MRYRSSQGYSLTPIWVLLAVNFLFFIASLVRPGLMMDLFGLHPISPIWPFDPSFTEQPWTIITNLFVHGSFWHLFANMITLYFFGSYVLRLIGEARFLLIYFGGGVLGNVLLLLLASRFPFGVAIGASGAVFALGGALAIMRPRLKVIIFPLPIPLDLWIAVIGGFLIMSFLPGVAWQAHLGGLVLGLVVGYIFRRRERRAFWR